MRAVVQRVLEAKVVVDGSIVGEIGAGLLILLGVEHEDAEEDAQWLAAKIAKMRVFSDAEGLMNRSVMDVEGELLVVSQFTLHASTKKGNRPSYIKSAKPKQAEPLYEYFMEQIWMDSGRPVKSGKFGADMKVHMIGDGPVTIIVDTKNKE